MKKKNYIYMLVPVVALVLFGAYYWQFSKGLAAREAQHQAAEDQKKKEKLEKQALDNKKAMDEAVAAQAKRKAEREAKDAKDKKDKDDRAAAVEARDAADRAQRKLNEQVGRLEKEVQTEKEAIAKLEGDKKKYTDEAAFLKTYVKQAEDNARSLSQVLDKIAAADAARAAADAAAAAEAKKNKS